MSNNYYRPESQKQLLKHLKTEESILTLKKQKTEIEDKIIEKERELEKFSLISNESIVISVKDCETENLHNLDERDTTIESCLEVLKVQVKNYVVQEKWGSIIDPFFVVDGEYYLFMGNDDYIFYKMFINNGDINCLWEKRYDNPQCVNSEHEWCDCKEYSEHESCDCKEYYTFPTTREREWTFCNCDYQNGVYKNNKWFNEDVETINKEYVRRLENTKQSETDECYVCKKFLYPYILDLSARDHLCLFCDVDDYVSIDNDNKND